jgi:peptidoglycan/LPS O-acetylase OafA/YrhL
MRLGGWPLKSARYEALDSLRGICALVVALFHFQGSGFLSRAAIISNGWLFVDFFFVLSGFVISAAYLERLSSGFSAWRFMALRLGRIYPLHIFIIALMLIIELALIGWSSWEGVADRAAFSGHRAVSGLVYTAGLLNAFGLLDGLSWNGPSWSIGAEMWAYVLFAAIVTIAGRRALFMFLAVAALAAATLAQFSPNWLNTTFDFGFVRCAYGFAIGSVIHGMIDKVPRPTSAMAGTSAECLAIIGAVLAVVYCAEGAATMLAPLMFAITVWVFAGEGGAVSRFLQSAPFVMLGALSYSIYMNHELLQGRFFDGLALTEHATGINIIAKSKDGGEHLVTSPITSDLLTLLMMTALIAMSWLTYRFVEVPCREWVRRRIAPKTGGLAPKETSTVG